MINKNKFSIKDTKKVLHKVGKKWVVVSAVLLGLAAGGAAVTTANADTTAQANQPATAQQVAKNANMSAANHSFGAADPANVGATKAPTTMKLGADNGISGLVNSVKSDAQTKLANHHLPSNISGLKSYAKSKASSADVTHLTDLANLARSNGQKDKYTSLVNLANNVNDRFNNVKVGSDTTTNSDANTVFGMLNDAYSDVSAINSGDYSNSTVSKVSHYLSDAQKLANSNVSHAFNASQLNSMIAQAGAKTLPTSVTVSGSSSSINLADYLQLPNDLSSNLLSEIKEYFNNLTVSASVPNTSVSVAPSYTLSLDIPTVINKGINVSDAVSNAVSEIINPASNSIQGKASGIATSLDNQIVKSLGNTSTGVISNLNNDISKADTKLLPIIQQEEQMNPKLKEIDSTISTLYSDSAAVDDILTADVNTELSGLNTLISSTASSKFASAIPSSTIAAKITNKLYSMGIGTSNGSFGPFTSDTVSPSAAYGFLTSSNSANANTISSLLSQFNVPNASGKVNKAISLLSEASKGLYGFENLANNYYNNLVSTAADLTNTDTNYKNAYSAYSSIASNASELNSLLSVASGMYNIPKYSDISGYVSTEIMSEASSSASSMSSTSASMGSALTEATNASTSANGLTTNEKNLENSLLSGSVVTLSDAKSNYYSTLSGANTDMPVDQVTVHFTGTSNNPSDVTLTGFSGESFPLNNSNLDIPNNDSIVSPTSASFTFSGRANNASVYSDDPVTVTLSAISNGSGQHHNGGSVTPPNHHTTPAYNGGGFVPMNNNYVAPASASVSTEPISATTNNISSVASTKAPVANYVTVSKELQLHTSPNFTKKNGVAVIEPNTRLDLEKTVRANHGLARYEVNYKGKNYFITANKRYTNHISYALAKPTHYRYLKVDKALQLHTSPYFTKKNGVLVVKPNSEFRINRVVKAHGLVRYEVNYKGNVYFITANKKFSANAYLQRGNFRKHGYKAVKVVKPLNEYRKLNFAKRSFLRKFYRGSVLPVKRVFTIGKGEMTRLELTNGHYVTANKNFVEVIK